MTLIEKAKISHKCVICGQDIELGEAYLQAVKDVGAGMAIIGVHADHIAHDKNNLRYLNKLDVKIINDICNTSVELVQAGANIFEAIKESKKIHGWSDWL